MNNINTMSVPIPIPKPPNVRRITSCKWNYSYQTICNTENECEIVVSIAPSFENKNKYWKYILKKNNKNEYFCYTQLFVNNDMILEIIEDFNDYLLEEIIPENKIQEKYAEK
jgi:hypothetical protein